MTRMLSLLCFCLLFPTRYCAADLPRWDKAAQGGFVTSLASDTQGRVWVGTEEQGVWVAGGTTPDKGWIHYGRKDGMGGDDVTALACDPKGRVWAGHRRGGVSVFNGQAWKSYDAVTGPLGSHVFALAVSPKDGDVWIATEAGLTRYSQSKDAWRYYTRTEGLPADQMQALAFDAQGTLYAGTQCDGLAIGSASDDYATWQHLLGPTRPSPFPTGSGFTDCRITALLAARDGSVYAGTPTGLVGSQDGGKTWNYLRGQDWYAKAKGRSGTVPAGLLPASVPTLSEDYVSALAEDGAGRLWIGHPAHGTEAADTAHANHALVSIFPQPDSPDVHCLLAPVGPSVLVGGYGSGLAVAASTDPSAPGWTVTPAPASAALPTPAAAPTAAELKALLAAIPAAATPMKPGDAAFLGDDWQTEGDWVGRYGRQYARLCGISAGSSPFTDTEAQEAGYSDDEGIGPHYKGYGGVYAYVGKPDTPDRRLPFSPALGHRRDAEVNDGSWDGGKYPATYEGPDLWITFTVPAGAHRASFYFVNNDGYDSLDSRRNYFLEMKADKPTLEAEDREPALASARVAGFYGGVYKQFLVMGPATFHLKIGRSYSSCTKIQGIFLDSLSGAFPAAAPPADAVTFPGSPLYLGMIIAGQSKTVVRVVSVFPGSPAAEAGIQAGDTLLFAGETPLTDPHTLNEIVASLDPDVVLPLTVKRGTKTLKIDVTPRPRPAAVHQVSSATHSLPPGFTAYVPPVVPPASATEPDTLTAARALWSALEAATQRSGNAAVQTRGRVLAYRAALAANAPAALLANWRWRLCLWSDTDRAGFDKAMGIVPTVPK